MSVTDIYEWRRPGCDTRCWPRSHDPEAHEEYGRLLEREHQRRSVVRTGPLVVDMDARTVTVNGEEIRPSGRELNVLIYLATYLGRWREVDEIVTDAWGAAAMLTSRGDRCSNLNTTIWRLRRRLGAAGYMVEHRQLGSVVYRRLRIEGPAL